MSGELKITEFAIILRNIVDLGKPQEMMTQEIVREAVGDLGCNDAEWFTVVTDVANKVCSLAKHDLIRLELPGIEVMDQPQSARKLFFLSDEKVADTFAGGPLYKVNLYTVFHRSGVLLVNIHIHYEDKAGISVMQAIDNARINLRTVVMKLPKIFARQENAPSRETSKEEEGREDRWRWISRPQGEFFIGTFKDLVSDILRPFFIGRLGNKLGLLPLRDYRCISSTLIQIYQTNPLCENIEEFVQPTAFGREIHGLGSLDKAYDSRSESAVVATFNNDLSDDEEAGVFTFGLSDLILFDRTFDKLNENTTQQKKFKDRHTTILYHTTHYSCILEWVYFEKYILDLYNRMLSRTIARKNTSPEEMLLIQKQTMHDLIGYKAGITPFPSREDFWEKARIAHRIPDAQEKFEKKRDLATDYVIQEYTLRTNKSIQLVNIFISATAAFSLMQVLVNIWQGVPGSKLLWLVLTAGLFVAMLVLLWGINRFFLELSQKKQ